MQCGLQMASFCHAAQAQIAVWRILIVQRAEPLTHQSLQTAEACADKSFICWSEWPICLPRGQNSTSLQMPLKCKTPAARVRNPKHGMLQWLLLEAHTTSTCDTQLDA